MSVSEWHYQPFKIMLFGLFGEQYFHRKQLLSQTLTLRSNTSVESGCGEKESCLLFFACFSLGHNPNEIEVDIETTLASLGQVLNM